MRKRELFLIATQGGRVLDLPVDDLPIFPTTGEHVVLDYNGVQISGNVLTTRYTIMTNTIEINLIISED